ncbi:calpain-like cysteine peptidase, putative [Leishmania guyanensis]|uniref:Calpain-like cysteine peptidase,putative,cysteine peptidase, Clan CA, family C2, putative n=1 Tax=Leishmania guyanensis TaxID=5670 RepID=A0A1E1J2K3_LEIGU|nr:calpain-like cysteine peptidase,putative,cysteine peptidase, Clan CA, family C2, putative [Leishmania guyanensis]
MVEPHRKFRLDAESVASLRAAVAANSKKQQRLEERLARCREQAARRSVLEQRLESLHTRIGELREMARPVALPPLSEDATASSNPNLPVSFSMSLGCTVLCPTSPGASGVLPQGNPSVATSSSVPDDFDETTIRLDSLPVPATWGRAASLFRYCGPSVKGIVSAVIDEGVLYRILTDGGDWAFYNDTRYYTVQVRYRIAAGSTVTPGNSVTVTEAGAEQELAMELGPEETKVFLTGRVMGFDSLCKAALLPRCVATAEEDEALCTEPQQHWSVLSTSYADVAVPVRHSVSTAHLVADCVAKQIRFVDLHFFPSHASLYRSGQDSFYVPPLHWRLPISYLPNDDSVRREVRLFRGAVLHPEGLRTGRLFPNHLFLSAAAGLACRWPQALRRLFIHPQGARQGKRDRAVGAHHVELCTGGWWCPWIVDEFFPAAARCPEFSHSADDLRVLWLLLLEKACAKVLGSYAATLNAPLEYFVSAFTGGPCKVLHEIWPGREDLRDSTAKATRFFALMKRLLRQRTTEMPSVVCWLRPYLSSAARTQKKGDPLEALYGDVGLDPNAATVVLGLETLRDGKCVVRLRQTAEKRRPAESWLDLWRRAGKLWVNEVSDLVFAMGETAGDTVWMALEDLPQYFQGGCVAPLTSDWGVAKVQGQFTQRQPSVVLQVTATAPTRLLVSVTQRHLDETGLSMLTLKDEDTLIGAGQTLAGLSCLLYSKGSGDSTHFLGSNGDSPDAFDLAQEPHFVYEREVAAGYLLDPCQGPYYAVPFVSSISSDVAYTITAQLVVAESRSTAAPLATPESSTATVRFMTTKPGTTLFPSLVQPILRESSMEVSATSRNYQSSSPKQLRMYYSTGVSVTLVLGGSDVPQQQQPDTSTPGPMYTCERTSTAEAH